MVICSRQQTWTLSLPTSDVNDRIQPRPERERIGWGRETFNFFSHRSPKIFHNLFFRLFLDVSKQLTIILLHRLALFVRFQLRTSNFIDTIVCFHLKIFCRQTRRWRSPLSCYLVMMNFSNLNNKKKIIANQSANKKRLLHKLLFHFLTLHHLKDDYWQLQNLFRKVKAWVRE